MCWFAPELGAVFSGDTLFQGGPGATGRSFSDFPTILDSIPNRLGTCPRDHRLHRPWRHHQIGDEIIDYDEWVARGHLTGDPRRSNNFEHEDLTLTRREAPA